jgi:hypothetical protein
MSGIKKGAGSRYGYPNTIPANGQDGFHPRRCGSPECDRYYVIIAQRRGGMGGQVLSPHSLYQYVVFHIKSRSNSPELKSLYYLLY